jgi:uncharacterized circularly permuted ATP-grasp superfamily protein
MFLPDGTPRPHCQGLVRALEGLTAQDYLERHQIADLALINQGITFTVYGDSQGIEKPFPVDLVPRVIPGHEWSHIERGLEQRVTALNLFLRDVYTDARILKEGVIPRELVVHAANYRREFVGAEVPHGIYVHICGTDLIRDNHGQYCVLEDNCRTPSGVSYMLENRMILMRVFPSLFADNQVMPVDAYPGLLLEMLRELAPPWVPDPTVVLLTPGVFNSAYFEHSFLAQQMGVELVEGRDLYVDDGVVYMKTTQGPKRVDVVYRRIDDDYLDPLTFRPESVLGVPGLVNAYRQGSVSLANGIGTGVADDKSIYPYVPAMIRFFLGQDPMLPQIETYMGWDSSQLDHILTNMDKMVVKAANESGGYGMLIGPQASQAELDDFRAKVKAEPRNYIAQPLIELSTSPCFVGHSFEPRHIDLRPYILNGPSGVKIVPGGLTRVALRKGSYVVNSSQGGGSKDTWVINSC